MDDTLKRLLDVEMHAERLAQQAETEQGRIVDQAMAEARAEQARFTARIPELRQGFIAKAGARAEQSIAELRRRYDERHIALRNQAEEREHEALEAAFQVLIDLRR
ncbi:ATPase [Marichromatium bheemlicum]|uniref:ATPase n=1 Tax=Marichromatium bheemlicum TaxID=365339 RepID=A0ABX1I5P0_9GAMM|nr:ATPase [Marichromatium bheemlicum]NKN32583.1 ATPase [Marichromatium bheemlicum]